MDILNKLREVRKKTWPHEYKSVDDLWAPLRECSTYLQGFLEGGPNPKVWREMFSACEEPGHIAFRVLNYLTRGMSQAEVEKLIKEATRQHMEAENKRIQDLIDNF